MACFSRAPASGRAGSRRCARWPCRSGPSRRATWRRRCRSTPASGGRRCRSCRTSAGRNRRRRRGCRGEPRPFQGSPSSFFSWTCSSISSARTSFLRWSLSRRAVMVRSLASAPALRRLPVVSKAAAPFSKSCSARGRRGSRRGCSPGRCRRRASCPGGGGGAGRPSAQGSSDDVAGSWMFLRESIPANSREGKFQFRLRQNTSTPSLARASCWCDFLR